MFTDVAFTVYAVTNMAESRAFYEGILGLVPNSDFAATPESKWIEYNIGSATVSIGESPDWKPSQDGAVVALETRDFEATIATLKKHLVRFVLEPQDFPGCHMAVIQDPDFNRIIIHQRKSK